MKGRIPLCVFSILAGASLAVAGYAAWVFSTSGNDDSFIGVDATGVAEGDVVVGDYSISGDSYELLLDQTNPNDSSSGVRFRNDFSLVFNYGMNSTSSLLSMYSYQFSWQVSFDISQGLSEYVDFSYAGEKLEVVDGRSQTFGFTSEWSEDGNYVIYDSADSSYVLTPSYADGMEPSTLDEYNAMNDSIYGKGLTTGTDMITINVSYVASPVLEVNPEHVVANPATCTQEGNIEYWILAGKYYSDSLCTNPISSSDTILPATGHTFSETSYEDGKYYKVCLADQHKEQVDVSTGYSVTVNGTTYSTYSCEETGVVSFDVVDNVFVIDASLDLFVDGMTIAGYDGEVRLSVPTDTEIAFLTFTNGFRKFEVVGSGRLIVAGDLSSEANVTTLSCPVSIGGKISTGALVVNDDMSVVGSVDNRAYDLTINSGVSIFKSDVSASISMLGGKAYIYGKLYAKDLTIGDENGTTSPELYIRGGGMTNENISWVGTLAVDFQILSGTVRIQKDGSYYTGIDVKGTNTGSVVRVGPYATLDISGFNHGVYFESSDGKLQIEGNVNIYATENGTNNTNVLIDGGTLVLKTEAWGIYKGAMTFNSGKATLIKNGFGYAAFYQITSLCVAEGFDLGIKSFNQIVYDSTIDETQLNSTITVGLNGSETQSISDGKYVSGTVTPTDLTIEEIPTYDQLSA